MKEVNILYVEDDAALSFITKEELSLAGYTVTHTDDGQEALDLFNNNHYDIAILDVMLPNVDGFSIAKEIRSKNEEIPILFLSAKSLEEDRLRGFELGADDYLTKPFSLEELFFKIKVFLKRRKINVPSGSASISIGNYTFEPSNLSLKNADAEHELTVKEADLLSLFIENKNETLKREDILVRLWGKNDYFLGRSLDVFISRLRKYLAGDSSLEIQTIRGVGFKLTA